MAGMKSFASAVFTLLSTITDISTALLAQIGVLVVYSTEVYNFSLFHHLPVSSLKKPHEFMRLKCC